MLEQPVVRPFSREEKTIFETAVELAKTNGLAHVESAEEGRGGSVIRRVLYPFELQYDYHLTVPQNLQRHAIQVWYERMLVFSAWRSIYNGQTIECVVIATDGAWRYFLRLRHERLHQRR